MIRHLFPLFPQGSTSVAPHESVVEESLKEINFLLAEVAIGFLSRGAMANDLKLGDRVFQYVLDQFGPHDVMYFLFSFIQISSHLKN